MLSRRVVTSRNCGSRSQWGWISSRGGPDRLLFSAAGSGCLQQMFSAKAEFRA
jgi:hypothetical protein